ncbi:DUF4198 domain-containing protein [Xanthomonas campestris pv. badrii]|uniref:DUF4198 domain-containing protein n=1 Tax=Xanthomonas campestris pv. badrii TaxID=149696 RepID=A0A7Z2ZHN7_XANCA|nr:DUF4198 domain-containing protein [Xanthomonas campestris]QJD68383.1 DUF4198 domain-containing protein [Xanthomonas campestris pv. badrii]
MQRSLVLIALLAALPVTALAHKAWLLPSQTVIAGQAPWITVDAAVSNDLFYFNHVPLRLDNLSITAPDGSALKPENPATGKYRSVFDLQLTQPGTYKLGIVNAGLFASWKEDGKPKRWRGNEASFASEVPKNAQDLQVSQSLSRVETFVTRGAPTTTVFKPSGKGIELVPVTHPNDLVAGEAAQFTLQLDGKPAAGLEIEIVRGGTRYRDAQNEIKLTTDAKGGFSVTWPEPGMYWLETSSEDSKTSLPQAKQRRLGYVVTLEVLPQ